MIGVSSLLARFRRESRGAAMIEFALIAPVLFLLLLGILEIALLVTAQIVLETAVADAGRTGITGRGAGTAARESAIREAVSRRVEPFLDAQELDLDSWVYERFQDIGAAEPFVDSDGSGSWNEGEPFTDVNGNGQWDADSGRAGLGGASEIVLYRLSYDWELLTPLVAKLLPGNGVFALQASVAVRNEPFSDDDT